MSNILRELTHENIAVLNNDECSSDVLAFINQSAWLWSAQQSQLQLGFGIFQVLLQHRTSPKRVRQKFHPKVANFCQTLCTFSVISPIRKCQRSLYLQGYWVVEEEVANIANKESGMPSLKHVIGYAWTTTNISGRRTNTVPILVQHFCSFECSFESSFENFSSTFLTKIFKGAFKGAFKEANFCTRIRPLLYFDIKSCVGSSKHLYVSKFGNLN